MLEWSFTYSRLHLFASHTFRVYKDLGVAEERNEDNRPGGASTCASLQLTGRLVRAF